MLLVTFLMLVIAPHLSVNFVELFTDYVSKNWVKASLSL